jgi:magnesium transporter
MLKFLSRYGSRAGQRPGLPEATPGEVHGDLAIEVTRLDDDATQTRILSVQDLPELEEKSAFLWIRIVGRPTLADLRRLGELYGLHTLTLEDMANLDHRPKLESFEDYLFVVARHFGWSQDDCRSRSGQVSIAMGAGWLLSVEQQQVPAFGEVKRRTVTHRERFLSRGISYLLYALLDALVDGGFTVLDEVGTRLAALERSLSSRVTAPLLLSGHDLRRELILMGSVIKPTRDLVRRLERGDAEAVSTETRVYLRDALDHAEQLVEATGVLQDVAEATLTTHLAVSSQRSTEVMQTLTVIATIFIPLTFIVGVYGMNFDWIPELHWRPAYLVVWGVMLAIGGGLLLWFQRRGWLGGGVPGRGRGEAGVGSRSPRAAERGREVDG